jgi:hypothetical protein
VLFLEELDHVTPEVSLSRETGRAFVEQNVLRTVGHAERFRNDKIVEPLACGKTQPRTAWRQEREHDEH